MKFFKKVIDAVKNFEKYEDFAIDRTFEAIKYITKLILIFVIVLSGMFTYKFYKSANNAISYFRENIPNLIFENNLLKVESEEPIIVENEEEVFSVIVIDTASEEGLEKYREKVDLYGNGIIILKDRILLRSSLLTEEIEYKYADIAQNYGIQRFDKQDANVYLAYINNFVTYIGVFIIVFIYMLIVYIATIFVDAVMLGVLAFILGRISGIKMSFKPAFNIGIYALTLPIILNMIYIVVNTLTGFTIENFKWMYTTISYIYVFIAILMIRTDLINRQMELIKLREEQAKVKEELEEKEQEEKNKEDKKEEEDKNKKDGKEDEGSMEGEPDGSQA